MDVKTQTPSGKATIALIALAPALFALSTWDPDYAPSPVRSISMPIILVEYGVIALAALTGRLLSAVRNIPKAVALTILAIVAIQIYTTAFVATNKMLAVILLVVTWGHILFAFACAGLFRFLDRLTLMNAIVAGLCIYAMLIYGLALSVASKPDFPWVHFGAAATNVRHLGYAGAVLTALALGLFTVTRNRWALIGIIFGFAFLFWTGSRGGIFAIGLMLCAVWLTAGWRKARTLGVVCVLSAIPALGLASIWVPPDPSWGVHRLWERSVGAGVQDPSSGRVEIWKGTLSQGLERPVFGWGEGQFKFNVPEAQRYYAHPHNAPIQFFYQWGLMGLLSLLCLLVIALGKTRPGHRNTDGTAYVGFMGFSAMLAFSLVDGTLYYPYPVMMTLVCLVVMTMNKSNWPIS